MEIKIPKEIHLPYNYIYPKSLGFLPADSSIIMAGRSSNTASSDIDGYVGRFSLQTGAVIWSKKIVCSILPVSVVEEVIVGNNTVYLAGQCTSASGAPSTRNLYLSRLQESGNLDWTYTYGNFEYNEAIHNGAFFNNNIVLIGTKLNYFSPAYF